MIFSEIDSYAVELSHEENMLIVDYQQFEDFKPAAHLIGIAAKFAGELSSIADNVVNSLQLNELMDKTVYDHIVCLEQTYSNGVLIQYYIKELAIDQD